MSRCESFGAGDSCEDVAQETFMRAMRDWDTFDGLTDSQRRSWLLKTARNIWIDNLRRERRTGEFPDEYRYDEDYSAADVASLCAALPDEERTLFLLRYFSGYNSSELGEMFGMSPSTVRAKLAKARRTIEKLYFGR